MKTKVMDVRKAFVPIILLLGLITCTSTSQTANNSCGLAWDDCFEQALKQSDECVEETCREAWLPAIERAVEIGDIYGLSSAVISFMDCLRLYAGNSCSIPPNCLKELNSALDICDSNYKACLEAD